MGKLTVKQEPFYSPGEEALLFLPSTTEDSVWEASLKHKPNMTAGISFSPTNNYGFASLSAYCTQYFPILTIQKQGLLSSCPSVVEIRFI